MNEQLKQAITLMQQGKEEGFNAVYSATYNHVYFRAKQTMKHEQDAEDLVQTVYTEAYRSISSLQSPDALFGWLDTITYNQGMKMFRKKKDVLLSEESEGMFEELETNDIASMPEPTMDEKETGNIIKELISELPEAQKASVTAYYFDGFSVGKIAEMMECTEGTVKSRLNYARKYLKDRILQKEKKEGYRLHVFSLPVLWYALWKLSQQTKMTAYAAETVYQKSCSKLGLTTTSLQPAPALVEAGAGTAQVMPTWVSAVADAGMAAGTVATNSVAGITAPNTGADSGTKASSVFNTSATSGAGTTGTGAPGAGAGTTGTGAAAAATGTFSIKAIIGALAAAAVVFVGAAVVLPRVLNVGQDDTQQARAGDSQDEDVASNTDESTNNADTGETDNTSTNEDVEDADADSSSDTAGTMASTEDIPFEPVRMTDEDDIRMLGDFASTVAELGDKDISEIQDMLETPDTMSTFLFLAAPSTNSNNTYEIPTAVGLPAYAYDKDFEKTEEMVQSLLALDYDFSQLPQEIEVYTDAQGVPNKDHGVICKNGTLTAWSFGWAGSTWAEFVDYVDNDDSTDMIFDIYSLGYQHEGSIALRLKPANNDYGYTLVGIYTSNGGRN